MISSQSESPTDTDAVWCVDGQTDRKPRPPPPAGEEDGRMLEMEVEEGSEQCMLGEHGGVRGVEVHVAVEVRLVRGDRGR